MWVDIGMMPDDFWHQTPIHFQAAMTGFANRRKREAESELFSSYNMAVFNAAASAGKLKPFAHYRKALKADKVAQTPQEMLQAFKELQAGGAPMTIKRIEREAA